MIKDYEDKKCKHKSTPEARQLINKNILLSCWNMSLLPLKMDGLCLNSASNELTMIKHLWDI